MVTDGVIITPNVLFMANLCAEFATTKDNMLNINAKKATGTDTLFNLSFKELNIKNIETINSTNNPAVK